MSKKIKLSGSSRRLIEKAIARNWKPGLSAAALARGHRRVSRFDEQFKKMGGTNEQ